MATKRSSASAARARTPKADGGAQLAARASARSSALDATAAAYAVRATPPAEVEWSSDEQYLSYAFEPQPPAMVSSWTIPLLRAARDLHQVGEFFGSGMLAETVMTDARVASANARRIGAVAGIPRRVTPPKRWNGKGLSEEIREGVQSLFHAESLSLSPGMVCECEWNLANMGFGIIQNVWRYDRAAQLLRPELRVWPAQLSNYSATARRYQVSTTDGLVTVTPGDGKWIVLEPKGRRSFLHGAIRAVALLWADRAYAQRDRSNHSAAHGSVRPIGYLPEGVRTTGPEGKKMERALRNLDNPRAGAVFSFGSKVTPYEPVTLAWQIFTQIDKATTEDFDVLYCGLANSPAVYQTKGQVEGVKADIVRADVDEMRARFRHGLVGPYVALNYGDDPDLVPGLDGWAVPDASEDDRRAAEIARHASFAEAVKAETDAGLLVDEERLEYLAEVYGVRTPKLAPPKPTPPALVPGAFGKPPPDGAPPGPPGEEPVAPEGGPPKEPPPPEG